jgi:hypothetical protein
MPGNSYCDGHATGGAGPLVGLDSVEAHTRQQQEGMRGAQHGIIQSGRDAPSTSEVVEACRHVAALHCRGRKTCLLLLCVAHTESVTLKARRERSIALKFSGEPKDAPAI